MQQLFGRFPSPSAVLVKLQSVKFLGLHWFLPLSTTLLQRLLDVGGFRKREEGNEQDFVVIISLHYKRWKRADPNGEDMQLEAVKNDAKALLDYLGYRHDNTDGRRWYFLMDYDLDYEDQSETIKRLPRTDIPTRDNILRVLREATCDGASGLIHYSGHCYSKAPGESELKHQANYIIYQESDVHCQGPDAAYLVTCDGKRLYGKDFYLAIQNTSNNAGGSTITVVLDTCKAEAFIRDFEDLFIVYDHEFAEPISNAPTSLQRALNQLVVVTAAREHEGAWTFRESGVMTYFLLSSLNKYPIAPAEKIVKYLNDECRKQPDEDKLQRPRIWSRYALSGPFRLLPSVPGLTNPSPPSTWHSAPEPYFTSATQYPLFLQSPRPMALSAMVV